MNGFRKALLMLLTCAALLTVPALAAEEQMVVGDATYNADQTVLLKYNAESAATSFSVPRTVVEIADGAFEGAANLAKLDLLNAHSLERIGARAFANSGITSMAIPGAHTERYLTNPEHAADEEPVYEDIPHPGVSTVGEEAFAGSAVLAIEFPESVTSLGGRMFQGCGALKGVTADYRGDLALGEDGVQFFQNCPDLEYVNFWGGIPAIGSEMFSGCSSLTGVSICSSVEADGAGPALIGENAFQGCTSLQSLTLPGSVASIGSGAFTDCRLLKNVTLLDASALTSIGSNAFSACRSLTKVVLTNGEALTSIGENAFKDCGNLSVCPIPQSLVSIGNSAFQGCGALSVPVDLPHLTTLGTAAFSGSGIVSLRLYNALSGIPGGSSKTAAFSGCKFLQSVVLPEGLTELRPYSFHCCEALETVALPSTLEIIGDSAFASCSSLSSLSLPEGLYYIGLRAFGSCTSLEQLSFPASLTTIGSYAFASCNRFTTALLPDTVTHPGEGLYQSCSGIRSLDIGGHTVIPAAFLQGSGITILDIPQGVTEVGKGAFKDCLGLTEVSFPTSLTAIGADAFSGCEKLQTPNFSESNLTEIGVDAFCRCTRFASPLTLPPKLTVLRNSFKGSGAQEIDLVHSAVTELDGTFCGWTNLTSITIPGSVKMVGTHTFMDCTKLTSVVLEEGVTTLGTEAFWRCSSLTSVTLPSTLTTMDGSFRGCSALPSIDLPQGLTSLGTHAFDGCRSLQTLDLPDGITQLEDYALQYCMALTSVELPASLESVGAYVFGNVNALQSLTFPAALTSIDPYAFRYCPNLTGVTFLGDAPSGAAEALSRGRVDQETIHIYYTQGAAGFDSADWDSAVFTLHAEEPVPPAVITPTLTFLKAPELRHSRQDELLLWVEVAISPETHPENSALIPCGALTMTVDGETFLPYSQFSSGNTGAHRELGWKLGSLEGKTITIQFTLATSAGYASVQSEPFTGTVRMPEAVDGVLPFEVVDPDPVDPDPVDPDPVDPDPVDPDPVDPDPVDPDPVDPDPVDPDPVNPDPVDPDPVDPDPVDPDPVDPDPVDPDPVDPDPVDPDPVDPDPVDPDPVDPDPVNPDPADPDPVTPGVTDPPVTTARGEEKNHPAETHISAADAREAMETAEGSGSVVLPVQVEAGASTASVSLSAAAVRAISGAKSVSLRSDAFTVTLDAAALAALEGKETVLSVSAVSKDALPQAAQSAGKVYDISITAGGKALSSFNGGQLKISLPYALSQGEDPSALTVCYVRRDGGLEPLTNGMYQDGAVTFLTDHLSTYAILSRPCSYTDLPGGHWAQSYVSFAGAHDLMKGIGNSRFAPNLTMDGATAVTVLSRLAGNADSPEGHWAASHLAWAQEAGLLPAGFLPEAELSRAQTAQLLAAFIAHQGLGVQEKVLPAFADLDGLSQDALDAIGLCYSLGLMEGRGNNTYVSEGSLTRSELAAILYRLSAIRLQ